MGWYDEAVKRVEGSRGKILRLDGKFTFMGEEYDYDRGFTGLIFKYGRHIEGVVTDLFEHPPGMSNQRYIIGRMSHSEIQFVKLPSQIKLEAYYYKAIVNGIKNQYDGILGCGRFEFLTGEWCTSLFAETIRFDFEYGKNKCQITVKEETGEDLVNELVGSLESTDEMRNILKKKCIDFFDIYNTDNEEDKGWFERYFKFLGGSDPEELWKAPENVEKREDDPEED